MRNILRHQERVGANDLSVRVGHNERIVRVAPHAPKDRRRTLERDRALAVEIRLRVESEYARQVRFGGESDSRNDIWGWSAHRCDHRDVLSIR
jgi:hypothetical protein